MPAGVLPAGGIARFYGEAAIHKDDPIAQRIWDRLVQPEKDRDPERKGSAVLVRVERSEDLLGRPRSEEHTSELQSLMRISYAVFCLKKKRKTQNIIDTDRI